MRVDKFIFSIDFVVLDIDQDIEVSLLLGMLFLAIALALIDVGSGKLVIQVGSYETSFDISKIAKQPMTQDDACYFVDLLHEPITSCSSHMISKFNFSIKGDRISIDESKLENNELVGSFSLIDVIDSCFTANYLNFCSEKVMMIRDIEEERQVEEGDASCKVHEEVEGEEKVDQDLNKLEPPTMLPPQLVLKPLPNDLEYASLGEGDTLMVVIS